MPFYEYECGACGKTHEAMQKVSDPPLRKCPACGKARLRKLMSAPIFRLKGSGWYETDFKTDQDKKRNLAVEKDDSPAKESPKADAPKADAPKAASASGEPAKTETPKKEAKSETPKAAASKPAARSAAKSKRSAGRKAKR